MSYPTPLPEVYSVAQSPPGYPPLPQTPVSQQPQSKAPMTCDPKNANNLQIGADGSRDWSSGLFGCFEEPDKAALACCCPCIAYSQNKNRYAHLVEHGQPDPTRGGPIMHVNCLLYLAMSLFSVGWLLQINTSLLVRQRYNIRGSPMQDVLLAACCIPCDFVRQSREIGFEEQALGQQRI